MPWPTTTDVVSRLGVPLAGPGDVADVDSALAAAIAYTEDNSTVWRAEQTGGATEPGPRVFRGVVDLTVMLYERRGATVDPFDELTPAQRAHAHRLLGIGHHALPFIGGA